MALTITNFKGTNVGTLTIYTVPANKVSEIKFLPFGNTQKNSNVSYIPYLYINNIIVASNNNGANANNNFIKNTTNGKEFINLTAENTPYDDFVLTAGQSIKVYSDSSNYGSTSYNFNVYEEDI